MAIFEDIWIEVQTATDPVVVGVCYRHPTSFVEDYIQFSNKLFEIFHQLNSDKRSFYALGDHNPDLLKIKTSNSVKMHMISLLCKCAIDLLARITNHSKTLIDYIHLNNLNKQTTSGIIISRILVTTMAYSF